MQTQKVKCINPAKSGVTQNLINCQIKNGALACRKGLKCYPETPIYSSDFSLYTENELKITNCYLFEKGEYGRVAVAVADNLSGNVVFNMKLLFLDRTTKEIGTIEFSKTTEGHFGYPNSFTVFSGKPTVGCGIYFICRQVYGPGIEDFVRVMELNSDKSEWLLLSSSEIYAPTLLLYGRGDSYNYALEEQGGLSLPSPKTYESRNLLSGKFISYYTSDGASDSFTLPLEGLDNQTVSAELVLNGQTFNWKVYAQSENSQAVEILEKKVIMLLSREKGRVYFKEEQGSDFALPYGGKTNNLKITAFKQHTDGAKKVASTSGVTPILGDTAKTESRVSAFWGGSINPANFIINSPKHPLYFPENAIFSLGEPNKEISSVVLKDNQIFAFKESEVFVAELGQYEGFEGLNLNTEITKTCDYYPLTFKKVADLPVPLLPKSVARCGDKLLFINVNGSLVKLIGNGKSAHKTETVAELLAAKNGFALSLGEDYLFFFEKGAYCFSGGVLSKWELPETAVGGFSYQNRLALFCSYKNGGVEIFYPATLGDGADQRVVSGEKVEQSVAAKYTVYPFENLFEPLKLSKIRIFGSGGRVEVSVLENENQKANKAAALSFGTALVLCGVLAANPAVELNFFGGEIKGIKLGWQPLEKF